MAIFSDLRSGLSTSLAFPSLGLYHLDMPKLIVFLGNPGIQYRNTRHNAGWMVCDRLVELQGLCDSWQTKFHALYTKRGDMVLLKPQTFMNESGISVQEAARFYGIKPQDILVVHDDIELAFGQVKIQLGGGMGGHNGLRSVKQHLGTDMFNRLRVGVGRPPAKIQVADFVLGRFSELEQNIMASAIEEAAKTALQYIG